MLSYLGPKSRSLRYLSIDSTRHLGSIPPVREGHRHKALWLYAN
jgi:hypothetical protein